MKEFSQNQAVCKWQTWALNPLFFFFSSKTTFVLYQVFVAWSSLVSEIGKEMNKKKVDRKCQQLQTCSSKIVLLIYQN